MANMENQELGYLAIRNKKRESRFGGKRESLIQLRRSSNNQNYANVASKFYKTLETDEERKVKVKKLMKRFRKVVAKIRIAL